MNGDYLKEFIQTIVFLMPVLVLVWKGAILTARLTHLEKLVDEKITKFCSDHRDIEKKLENAEKETELSITQLLNTLNEIQKTIVRIETKIDINEKK